MKIKLLILFIASVILSTNSCKEEDCYGEPAAVYFDEVIYLNIIDKQGGNIFLGEFSIDSLKIFENKQELSYEYSNSLIKFQLSNDFYKRIIDNSDMEIIENVYFQYDYNTVDTLTIKTTHKFYPENCDRSAYSNTKIFYNSKLLIENADAIVLFNSNRSNPLIITRL